MSSFLSDNTENIIYFGEKLCENFTKKENKPCTNFAYYLYNGKYCCGRTTVNYFLLKLMFYY